MISHLAIEDELTRLTGINQHSFCVTSVPDAKRGERLVVVYTNLSMPPHSVVELMRSSNISRLWIPDEGDFIYLKGTISDIVRKKIGRQERNQSSA